MSSHNTRNGPAITGATAWRSAVRSSYQQEDLENPELGLPERGGVELGDALNRTVSRSSRSTSGRHHLRHHLHLSNVKHHLRESEATAPLHDAFGRPIRRHGPETFGEVMLHPLKELELHRQRNQEYTQQKQEYEAQHPGETFVAAAPAPEEEEKPRLRTLIHFRHLVGDQTIRITTDIADQLRDPLAITDEELLRLYEMQNTDELVEFFQKSGRDYSIKIHKTMDVRAELASKKSGLENLKEEVKYGLKGEHKSRDLNSETISEKTMDNAEALAPPSPSPSTPALEKDQKETPAAVTIELNSNVYLELKYYWPEHEEEKSDPSNTRRPIFLLPDPDLSDEIGVETAATWTELFGDVFYVGWLSTFTHAHHMANGESLGRYVAWFVVMWWTWCSSALYSSRYDSADVMHHIYKIIELCGLVGMAAASNSFWDSPRGFIIGYMGKSLYFPYYAGSYAAVVVMKAILLIEYGVVLWASILSGSFAKRPLSGYVAINALSIIMWGISLHFDGPDTHDRVARFVLWYLSIFIEAMVNIVLKRSKQVSLAASHLGERFGLFTIIVLGENCMGFMKMVAEANTEIRVVVANMFGVVIIFLYFFMYFDDFSKEASFYNPRTIYGLHILCEVEMSQLWMYLHFPLHLCQVAFGIALTDLITIFSNGWDDPVHGFEKMLHDCPKIRTSSSPSLITNSALSLLSALSSGTEAVHGAEVESTGGHGSECEFDDPHTLYYVFSAFWISGGLILCINALIKLVNTPVAGKNYYILFYYILF
ncbi:hypothetical protein DFQ28_003309 [Apophysomyces sp. BC1034]|nr:hypothetical protein DFQ30_007756 [Apophysomyces sp. BC1015]KAG0178094.1 hypothetical protein DFQ29_003939 [Apophysomyces sp. BC1021]KAG0189531.1 hypothetical protein DFQ28_003309 [Apophysomyces sp. BC1034]